MAREIKSSVSKLEILSELKVWGETYGQSQDPYLEALSGAIENESGLDYWASIDPLQYLPTTDGQTSITELKVSRVVASFRNVIIFLPVAITWAAVSEATTAFNEFVQTNTGTPANFLQFWQDGYGILDSFWKISSVAMLDFALVLAVIFMSATVSVAQARGLVKASRLQSAFSRDRRLLGLRINSYVFSYRAVTGASVPNDIQKTVESLRLAMRESQTNIEGLRKSTESLAKAIPTINEKSLELAKSSEVLGKSLEVVLGQTAKSVERILSDIDGTGTAIKTSARAVQDQIQSLQREISRKK